MTDQLFIEDKHDTNTDVMNPRPLSMTSDHRSAEIANFAQWNEVSEQQPL